MLRDHSCGALRIAQAGQEVRLAGWVHAKRDHGGVCFFNLRDRTGQVQVVAHPEVEPAFQTAQKLGLEYVVSVQGTVERRPAGTENPKTPTGLIEIRAAEISVLNGSKALPFMIEDDMTATEETKLKYRYLDLRRPRMLANLSVRHRAAMTVRRVLDQEGFLEIETPILSKATPEGARDFLVPSRLSPGTFYALPQSPQIYKQILMVSGTERYFQLARAFRDEDLRSDRQPEHTQIDLEMSFVDEERDVHAVVEKLMLAVFQEAAGTALPAPFAAMDYDEVMLRYGSDKPDLRYGLELRDCSEVLAKCGFKVFGETVRSGGRVPLQDAGRDRPVQYSGKGRVACLNVPGEAVNRSMIDRLTEFVKGQGAKGLPWIRWKESPESPIVKFLTPEEIAGLRALLDIKPGDITFFGVGEGHVPCSHLGALRKELIAKLKIQPSGDPWRFLWVTRFPLLERVPEEDRWTFTHNPFTAPIASDLSKLDTDPGAVRSHQYDLVLNGVELASGSIRNHRSQTQRKILGLMGFGPEEQQSQFGLLLNALDYGAPPHGGIAMGFDRLIAILRGEDSIRDVIAFPKTQKGTCPLSEAPSVVNPKQLKELQIKPDPAPKT